MYLRVVNWHDYQHYKNRRAPWIKAYTEIVELPLEHPTFTNLSDGAKLTLHHVRLLAGITANQIPDVALTSDRLNMKTKPRIDELVTAGFVEWFEPDSRVLASEQTENQGALASENTRDSLANGDVLASERLCAPARAGGRARSQASQDLDSKASRKEKKKLRASAREMIESFSITDALRAWAVENVPGIDIDAATAAWRDHFRSNGYKTRAGPLCDADAAWRNWMKRDFEYSRRSHGGRASGGGGDSRTDGRRAAPDSTAGALGTRRAHNPLDLLKSDPTN